MTLQYAFSDIVQKDFENAGCATQLTKALDEVASLSTTSSGRDKLTQVFSLCSALHTEKEALQLTEYIENALIYTAMVDYPYAASFLMDLPAWPVKVPLPPKAIHTHIDRTYIIYHILFYNF